MYKINQAGIAHPLVLGAIVAVVAVTGVSGYIVFKNQADTAPLSSQTGITQKEALPATLDDTISLPEATELATANTDASASSVELQTDDGITVYKVRLSNGTVILLNAKTGAKIVKTQTEIETEKAKNTSDDSTLPAGYAVTVTPEQARKAAVAYLKNNSTITRISLHVENGVVVLRVRFANNARVDIDAKTGEVVRAKAANDTKLVKPSSTDDSRQIRQRVEDRRTKTTESTDDSSTPTDDTTSGKNTQKTENSSSSDDSPSSSDDSSGHGRGRSDSSSDDN